MKKELINALRLCGVTWKKRREGKGLRFYYRGLKLVSANNWNHADYIIHERGIV